ncbi:MAG: aldo/keto reductase [Rhodobacteraceae bacterium]|nr:aldo/keto reductase [Paracoccaceae bacterium]
MQKTKLGRSDLTVSAYCLGTMTFGSETPEEDAHRQLDLAWERGINFLDAAEMYPVNPVTFETAGRTEEIIGRWLASRKPAEAIIATKITGAGSAAVKDGAPITPARMQETVEASLKRLQTDCIDIYQLHWPNRGSYHFRKMWGYDPSGQNRAETVAHMTEILQLAQKLVEQGKIRHFALSNETAWGTAMWLRLAEQMGLPRAVSIQNEYSLLCRMFDLDMAELSVNEDVPLLSYSSLAAGLLTGKYAGNVIPENTRRERNSDLGGRITPRVFEAVSGYLSIANEADIDPVHMAYQWTRTRPFQCTPIVGARNTAQLEHLLEGVDLELPQDVCQAIDKMHRAMPLPF